MNVLNSKLALMVLVTAMSLTGCLEEEPTEEAEAATDTTVTPPPASVNESPSISGSPMRSIVIGEAYSFTPTASDPEGDQLTFSVVNKPAWADFDSATGTISGTPSLGDIGTAGPIVLSVSDSVSSASLSSFWVQVMDVDGPPPQTADGWPSGIPMIPFDYEQIPGAPTQSGNLPSTLAAGEVLELGVETVNGDPTISCSGTEQNPAFIVGGMISGSNDVLRVSGSWCIFVGTVFDDIQVRVGGDHHILRDIEIRNHVGKDGSNLGGSNIVLIGSEIHHNQGNDRHGVQVTSGARDIWVLRNDIHHNGGDGFQACHQCSDNPPMNVYIGQNVFHSDRENGVDFKFIENVVVSGNILHSYVVAPRDTYWCFDDGSGCGTYTSGSDGSAIVLGSDGGPTNVLVTENEIYNSDNAIRIERAIDASIVSNNFHEIANNCLSLEKEGLETIFDNNVCTNASRGIFQFWRVDFSMFVTNNTFDNISGPAIEYEASQVADSSILENNVFSDTGPVIYNQTVATSAAEINSLPNSSGNSVD